MSATSYASLNPELEKIMARSCCVGVPITTSFTCVHQFSNILSGIDMCFEGKRGNINVLS
jgi:hypothetical protein